MKNKLHAYLFGNHWYFIHHEDNLLCAFRAIYLSPFTHSRELALALSVLCIHVNKQHGNTTMKRKEKLFFSIKVYFGNSFERVIFFPNYVFPRVIA